MSWFPFFVRAVQIYAAANLPQAAFLAPTPETFRQFLDQQQIFVFFVTVYVGAGLDPHATDEDVMRVFVPGEGGARRLYELASSERVQVRHLRPSVPTLEDVFAHAVGEQ